MEKENMVKITLAADGWRIQAGTPAPGWENKIPVKAKKFVFGGKLDLDSVIRWKESEECTVYLEFNAESAGNALLGLSADWFLEAYVNGTLILSTMRGGNGSSAYVPEDHPCFAPVRAGKNLLAVRLKRGSFTGTFACAPVTVFPRTAKVLRGPWLCNPDVGTMGVRFLTGDHVAAGVEYSWSGESEWHRTWHSRHGQLCRTDNHLITLKNLIPGAQYRYRIILRGPTLPYESMQNVISEEEFTFTVPDESKETVSFLYTADLQFPFPRQKEVIDKMFPAAECESCDFLVFGGDFSQFNDIRKELIDTSIQSAIDHGANRKPLIFCRGNHEMRGTEAWKFPDFFGFEDGRTSGVFRYGSTAFLVLDCWEDKPAVCRSAYTAFNQDETFLKEQAAHLEKLLSSPAWRSARRHIVLAHGCTYSNFDSCRWMPYQLQMLTDRYFHGKNPPQKLDLWLAGHSHVHLRSFPGSNVLAAPAMPPAPHRSGEEDIYPVLTVGGPNRRNQVQASVWRVDVSADRIAVKAFDQDGQKIDDAIFFNDGKIEEKMKVPHFEVPAQPGVMDDWVR